MFGNRKYSLVSSSKLTSGSSHFRFKLDQFWISSFWTLLLRVASTFWVSYSIMIGTEPLICVQSWYYTLWNILHILGCWSLSSGPVTAAEISTFLLLQFLNLLSHPYSSGLRRLGRSEGVDSQSFSQAWVRLPAFFLPSCHLTYMLAQGTLFCYLEGCPWTVQHVFSLLMDPPIWGFCNSTLLYEVSSEVAWSLCVKPLSEIYTTTSPLFSSLHSLGLS